MFRTFIKHSIVIALLCSTPSCGVFAADPPLDPNLPADWKAAAEEWKHFQENPPKTEQERLRASALQTQLAILAVRASKGNFSIKGEVVDEDGKPLKDVTLHIVQFNGPSFEHGPGGVQEVYSDLKGEEKKFDEKFEVKADGSSGLGLEFIKEGYKSESMAFDSGILRPDDLKSLFAGGNVAPSLVVENGVRVELRACQKITLSLF